MQKESKNLIKKKARNKRKKGKSKPSPKKRAVFRIREPEGVEQQVTLTIQILMRTYHILVKHAVAKRKILEYVSEVEKVMLRF